MKTCKTCGLEHSDIIMIRNTCYLCILAQWPPVSHRQVKDYKKAIAIRLALATPLTTTNAPAIVERVGLDRLEFLNEIIKGYVVDHQPGPTFCKRLGAYLDGEG